MDRRLPVKSSGVASPHDVRAVVKGGGAVLLASIAGNGLNYAFGIFLARSIGPSEFGLYALGLTVFNTLALLALGGMDVGAVKFVSAALSRGRGDDARTTVLQTMTLTAFIGIVAGLGLAAFAGTIATSVYGRPDLETVLLFFAAAVPLSAISALLIATLQAFQTVRYTIAIKYVWEPIGKFVLATGALWAGWGLVGVLAAFVLVSAVSVLVVAVAAWRLSGMRRHGPRLRWHTVRALLAFCLPLTAATLFGVVAPRADVLFLGYWAGAQDAGIYLAAFQTAAILSLVLGAFDTALAPMIARVWAQRDRARIERVYQDISRLILTCATPLCVVMIVFSRELLTVFGEGFAAGASCLGVLAAGQLVNSAAGAANTVLLMSGHSRLVMINTVVSGLILIAATAVVTPRWGMFGAAAAASATLCLVNAVRVLQVWRLHRIVPYTWSSAKSLLAGACAAGIVGAVKAAVSPSDLLPVLSLGLAAAVVYAGCLLILGLEQADRVMLGSLLEKAKVRAA
jgi:O-antigen/teichoic acid export membrane protein